MSVNPATWSASRQCLEARCVAIPRPPPQLTTTTLADDWRVRYSTTPLEKHPPIGNPPWRGATASITLCPAPPTTAAPTQTSTTATTATVTTRTRTSITTSISTTTTTTSTTTEMPDPTRPPLDAPTMNPDGSLNLIRADGRHSREQGVMASYYTYANKHDVVTVERDGYGATRRNWFHGSSADAGSVIPQINFPPHVRHRMGSSYDEHFATRFYGEIEITRAGVYNFSMLCSDDCGFRLQVNASKSITSSANALLSVYGPRAPTEVKAKPVELNVGYYRFLVTHGAFKNDTGSDASLRENLGLACVLYWETPQYTKREVPAWAFSHRAPVTAKQSDNYLYEVTGQQIVDAEPGNPSTSSSAGQDLTWYGTEVSPSWHRIDLGYICEVYNVTVVSYRWYQGVDVRIGNSLAPYDYSANILCNSTGNFGGNVNGWEPNHTVSCRGLRGRYLYTLGNRSSQRLYNVVVHATPVRSSPLPSQFSWPRTSVTPYWQRSSEIVPNSAWWSRLDNLYRVYASLESSDRRDSPHFWAYDGSGTLHETFYYDYDGWKRMRLPNPRSLSLMLRY